ncbi:hypothetical protein, partial [Serratia marcescens]|uniref:hypothetical protein n=1 Tax=Serratia marcescens TaxID=615 RepID=UPI001966D052
MHIIFTGKFSSKYPSLLLTVVQITTVAVLSTSFALFTEDWRQAIHPEVLLQGNVFSALLITSVFA